MKTSRLSTGAQDAQLPVHAGLVATLKPYQRRALAWMAQREEAGAEQAVAELGRASRV